MSFFPNNGNFKSYFPCKCIFNTNICFWQIICQHTISFVLLGGHRMTGAKTGNFCYVEASRRLLVIRRLVTVRLCMWFSLIQGVIVATFKESQCSINPGVNEDNSDTFCFASPSLRQRLNSHSSAYISDHLRN